MITKAARKSKHRTRSKRNHPSKSASLQQTENHCPHKMSDIDMFFQQMQKISSSILSEQISSLNLQKQALKDFLADLNHFWTMLLSDLNHQIEEEQEKSGSPPLALNYLKRQGIVANEIVRFRSESELQISRLAQQEIQLARLHSLTSKITSIHYRQ